MKLNYQSLSAHSILAIAVLSIFSSIAYADPVFISDKLVVNVYAEANQESEKIETLESGAALESTDKAEGYTRVKLADGREGWIKSSYLSAQKPAIVRLRELEKEHASISTAPPKTAEELKHLQEQNSALHTEIDALKKAAANSRPQPASEIREVTTTVIRSEAPPAMHAVKWGAGVGAIGGLIGFAFGYWMIARRIKRKYGNLRIY
jgi:SH3 domain protein